jgi:hypothetical protein
MFSYGPPQPHIQLPPNDGTVGYPWRTIPQAKRVALYLRVSTADQITANQHWALKAVARATADRKLAYLGWNR